MWQKPAKRAKSRQEKEVLETVVPTPFRIILLKFRIKFRKCSTSLGVKELKELSLRLGVKPLPCK